MDMDMPEDVARAGSAMMILDRSGAGKNGSEADRRRRRGGLSAAVFLILLVQADPPSFDGLRWVDAAPDLRGKVVVVRWWTTGCGLCSTSAPVLARLAEKASVVAVFHPKPRREVGDDEVRAWAKEIGMPGALAIDRDWAVLDRWKAPAARTFTSLTFLLDRKGKIRYAHPGGTITEEEGIELGRRIDALLAEE